MQNKSVKQLLEIINEASIELASRTAKTEEVKAVKFIEPDYIKNRLSQNSKRHEAIDLAIKDLNLLSNNRGQYVVGHFLTMPEFIINEEKRTVVCLLRGINSNKVRSKGIAKTHPNDTFNIHIGKSVSLRKAMGHVIPNSIVDPQPVIPEVGDIINFATQTYKVVKNSNEWRAGVTAVIGSPAVVNGKIINDSKDN